MNIFLDLLKGMFCSFLAIFIVLAIVYWLTTSTKTLYYTKQNNILLKELCIKNGLNVDSLMTITQNDTLNLKFGIKDSKNYGRENYGLDSKRY